MFDTTNLKKSVSSFDYSPQLDGYTKVVIDVSDEVQYTAGTDTGRTLTLYCPWATQQTADDILSTIQGFQFQPYTSTGAIIDPSAELGDGVTIDGIYSGIYTEDIDYGPLYTADISAPFDEEIDHEFKFVSEKERRVQRSLRNLSSSLSVQAGKIEAEVTERKAFDEEITSTLSVQSGQIAARVEKTGGDSSSFGWVLEDNEWRITANGSTVLKATQNGLDITGRVTATSGKIGGFDIIDNHLSTNNAEWGGSNTYGVYVGPQGIQLGSYDNGFRVDSAGNLYANSGHFRGAVDANSINYGGDSGYFSGAGLTSGSVSGGWNGEIARNTISTSNTTGGVNTSLGYADFAHDVFDNNAEAYYMKCRVLKVTGSFINLRNSNAQWITIKVGGKSYRVLGEA